MKIDFDTFMQEIMEELRNKLGSGCTVSRQAIRKNNGVIRQTVMISDEAHTASPCYGMEKYYELYREPADIKAIAGDVLKIYRQESMLDFAVGWIQDRDEMLSRVLFRIVSTDSNAGLLENAPHQDIPELNLSMLFYLPVDRDGENHASALLLDRHMKMWETSVAELLEYAWKNTAVEMGYTISSMKDLFHESLEGYPGEPLPMYVVTNRLKLYGAGCILYPEVLEAAAQKLGSDFYILPSSVHETIVVPAESFSKGHAENLKTIVQEINKSTLMCEEVLSNSVYYYCREKHRLFLAA